ncbi:MAG: hypothetical protein RI897_3225 [Verrucomicrobiota bacterium]
MVGQEESLSEGEAKSSEREFTLGAQWKRQLPLSETCQGEAARRLARGMRGEAWERAFSAVG